MECRKFVSVGIFVAIFTISRVSISAQESDPAPTPLEQEIPAVPKEKTKDGERKTHEHGKDHLLEAPAGLMGTHTHTPGTITVEYRYMLMNMSGLYQGGGKMDPTLPLILPHNTVTTMNPMAGMAMPSSTTTSSTYMMTPVKMNMEMHMATAMFAITENLTAMAMIPYVRNTMEMLNAGSYLNSYMSAKGAGDIQGQLSYRFVHKENHNLLVNFGFSFPTGSIDEKDYMGPGTVRSKVPYNMQPGTGTYNPSPGLTYTGKWEKVFWGSQAFANLRNGKNANAYKFGNRYEASVWIGYKIADWISLLGRFQFQKWENISGADPTLSILMDPQNDPERQGGRRSVVYAGTNIRLPFSSEVETRLNLEYGVPVYQHLNGPQLGLKSAFNVSAQAIF
ncbi:transporter [Leptospira fluminis]|uniref:transporter n=1 Tax=Leptospira fluminis TaxID=2484979 RepID=UPI001FE4C374|nr:transporter [Leptospira fluminis]